MVSLQQGVCRRSLPVHYGARCALLSIYAVRAAQEVKQLMQERDQANAQVAQVGQRLSTVRAEQKSIVDARNKHDKKWVLSTRDIS